MKNIKTFEDALKVLNLDSSIVPDFSMVPELHREAMLAHFKLVIILQALNESWKPNWNNYSEYKWYPWLEVDASKDKPSGFGFSVTDFTYSGTYTCVGSRLCSKSEEIAKYAFKTFPELYISYFLYTDK